MAKNFIDSKIQKFSNLVGLDLPYFIKGGFWLIFSITTAALGGLFLSSLFARVWPKDVFGQYSFLMAALGFLGLTTLPGMGQAIVQAVSEGKEGTYWFATKLLFKWSLLGTIFLLLGSAYFYIRENQNLALAVLFAALVFPLNGSLGLFSSYLNGMKDFKKMAIYSTSTQLFSIGAVSIVLLNFSSLVLVALTATWSAALAYSFFTYLTFRKIRNNLVDFKLIKLGKALSVTAVMTNGVDYFDRFAIPFFLGFSENAVYAIAIIIPMQMLNFLKVSTNLAQPKLVEIKEEKARKVLLFKSIQLEIPIVIMVLAYILAAPTIFKFLYPDYQPAVFLSQVFAISILYYPSNLFGLYLIKKRAIGKALLSAVIYVVVSIISLLIFLSLWGLIGAVFSKIFVKIVQVVITQIFFNSELAKAKASNEEY